MYPKVCNENIVNLINTDGTLPVLFQKSPTQLELGRFLEENQ